MEKLLVHLGIPFVRVPAVDGSTLTDTPIAPNYYGNFLSHIKCWEMIAEGSEPFGLCLEDDVVFARNFRELLDDNRIFKLGADILRLEAFPTTMVLGPKLATLAGGYHARRLHNPSFGMAAYIVSRVGAKWLLENANPVDNVDEVVFGSDFCRSRRILTLLPSPCTQYENAKGVPHNPAVSASTVDTQRLARPRSKKTLATRIRNELDVALNRIRGRVRIDPTLHPSGPLVLSLRGRMRSAERPVHTQPPTSARVARSDLSGDRPTANWLGQHGAIRPFLQRVCRAKWLE